MSSFVGLTSLYGCGGPDCDGATLKTCVDDASGTTAPGRMLEDDLSGISLWNSEFAMQQVEAFKARAEAEGRSLSDVKKACEDAQKMLDCYKSDCSCQCQDLKENGGGECAKDDETVADSLKALMPALEAGCTGDNKLTNPC